MVAVRSCHYDAMNRGLQNLGSSRKGDGFILFACTKRTKSTPEVCEPLDSGDDSKLCRKWFCRNFRRLMSKPVLPAKRRRKGFESVRKGGCTANARPLFFEKELFYCKLTVASDIRKGLLLVSFCAVGSWNFSMLKKAFLYRVALHELKKFAFSANPKSFFCTNLSFIPTQNNSFPPSAAHSNHP